MFPGRLTVLPRDTSSLGIDKMLGHTASGSCSLQPRRQEREIHLLSALSVRFTTLSWVPWRKVIIPAFRRLRQEDCCRFEASVGYLMSSSPD